MFFGAVESTDCWMRLYGWEETWKGRKDFKLIITCILTIKNKSEIMLKQVENKIFKAVFLFTFLIFLLISLQAKAQIERIDSCYKSYFSSFNACLEVFNHDTLVRDDFYLNECKGVLLINYDEYPRCYITNHVFKTKKYKCDYLDLIDFNPSKNPNFFDSIEVNISTVVELSNQFEKTIYLPNLKINPDSILLILCNGKVDKKTKPESILLKIKNLLIIGNVSNLEKFNLVENLIIYDGKVKKNEIVSIQKFKKLKQLSIKNFSCNEIKTYLKILKKSRSVILLEIDVKDVRSYKDWMEVINLINNCNLIKELRLINFNNMNISKEELVSKLNIKNIKC